MLYVFGESRITSPALCDPPLIVLTLILNRFHGIRYEPAEAIP